MFRLFDAYLAVDWSARTVPSPARPSADALWVGERGALDDPGSSPPNETYWRTRQACVAHVRARLQAHVAAGRRVLIGFDFPYGYPAGYAAALGLAGPAPPWRRLWDLLAAAVTDDTANANNRFGVAAALNARCGPPGPGPLWGCPPRATAPALAPTSPPFPYPVGPGRALARRRRTELGLRGVQPCWKLAGVGSVGGQALVGIPYLHALRDDPTLAPVSRVWPFETGFTPVPGRRAGPAILHAEIWPGLLRTRVDPTLPVRDQAQVRAVVAWMAESDADGTLGARFTAPPALTSTQLAACVAEEGWLLGA